MILHLDAFDVVDLARVERPRKDSQAVPGPASPAVPVVIFIAATATVAARQCQLQSRGPRLPPGPVEHRWR